MPEGRIQIFSKAAIYVICYTVAQVMTKEFEEEDERGFEEIIWVVDEE